MWGNTETQWDRNQIFGHGHISLDKVLRHSFNKDSTNQNAVQVLSGHQGSTFEEQWHLDVFKVMGCDHIT